MLILFLLFTNNIYTLCGDIKSENDGFSLGDLVEIPEMNKGRGRVYGYLTSFSKIFQILSVSFINGGNRSTNTWRKPRSAACYRQIVT